jgi:hypothetical protein
MDPTHLHLLLNHVPTIGFGIAVALYAVSLWIGSRDLKLAGLVLFVLVALATLPAYVTGNAAQLAISGNEGVSTSLIETHEGAAFLSLVVMQITGALAWLALWITRRGWRLSSGLAGTILALSVVTFALMAQTAKLGGEINHPELRGAAEPVFIGSFARVLGDFVRDAPWAWIAAETVHFVGLSLVLGVMLLVNLRVLGVMKRLPFTVLDRMLPWAMLGFAANVVTGMLFVAASYGQYVSSDTFYWKLLFIVLAGLNTLYFTFDRTWLLGADGEAPASSKALAVTAMLLWVGVLYWGSMLPFLGTAF